MHCRWPVVFAACGAFAGTALTQAPSSVVHAVSNGGSTGFLVAGDTVHALAATYPGGFPSYNWTYYRSVDRGRTWTSQGIVAQPIVSPTIAADGQAVYIVHRSGVHASSDAGVTWQSFPFPSIHDRPHQVIAEGGVCHVVMATGTGPYAFSYLRSIDGGATWTTPSSPAPTTANWFVMRPMGSTMLLWFSDANDMRYQHSTDRGATWSAATQLPGSVATANPPTLQEGGSVLHCAWQTALGVNYQRSTDQGATWLPSPQFFAATPLSTISMPVVVPVETGAVVHLAANTTVGTSYWRSTDAGQSWSAQPTVFALGDFVASGSHAYLVQRNPTTGWLLEVRWSQDHGATWAPNAIPVGTHGVTNGPYVQAKDDAICIAWSGSGPNGVERSVAVGTDMSVPWSVSTTYGGGNPSVYWRDSVLAVQWIWFHYVMVTFTWEGLPIQVSTDGGATWQHKDFGNLFTGGYGSFLDFGDSLVFAYNLGFQQIQQSLSALLWGYQPYGAAKPGTNGIAARIRGSGQPTLGETIQVNVDRALGGSLAVIGATFDGPADLPLASGRLLIQPPGVAFWGITTGAAGAPGVGTSSLPLAIPADPALHRLRLNCQGFVLDPGAVDGFSSTAGLEMWIW